MPVLSNPRHERFCQELAKGNSAEEAYRLAGYNSTGNSVRVCASKLLTNVTIAHRRDEILEKAAKRAEVTVQSLMDEADEIRRLALAAEQYAAALGAVREKGVLSGKRIERSEAGEPGEFERLEDMEVYEMLRQQANELGITMPRNATEH
jgi:phage terminase small subunit